jgi:hypothetical protein
MSRLPKHLRGSAIDESGLMGIVRESWLGVKLFVFIAMCVFFSCVAVNFITTGRLIG